MSRSLESFVTRNDDGEIVAGKDRREAAIKRRLSAGLEVLDSGNSPGLSYWGARDARLNHGVIAVPATPTAIS